MTSFVLAVTALTFMVGAVIAAFTMPLLVTLPVGGLAGLILGLTLSDALDWLRS